jgi:hypothetical protein
LLTNSALVYEPKCGGSGELRGLSQRVQLYTGAQINTGDLSPYLTYGYNLRRLKKIILSQKNTEIHPAEDIFKQSCGTRTGTGTVGTVTFCLVEPEQEL